MPVASALFGALLIASQSTSVTVRAPDVKLAGATSSAHVPSFTMQCQAGRVLPLRGHDDDGALRSYALVAEWVQGSLRKDGRCVVARDASLSVEMCCDGARHIEGAPGLRILVDDVAEQATPWKDWPAFRPPEPVPRGRRCSRTGVRAPAEIPVPAGISEQRAANFLRACSSWKTVAPRTSTSLRAPPDVRAASGRVLPSAGNRHGPICKEARRRSE